MKIARYLAAMLLTASALAAPVTLRWTNPTQWTDGAPLAAIEHAQLYCRTAAGPYTSAQGAPGNVATMTLDVATQRDCALTVFARAPDGSLRESDFSAEFRITPKTIGAPTTITVEWQSPAVCTTTCAVTRTR